MPLWAWLAIVGGALLVVGAAVALVIVGRRAYTRRAMLRLLVSAEAIEAAETALVDTFERLAGGSDADLEVFADEPQSAERSALGEVVSRARMLADELDRIALPRTLIPVAEALADAAHVVGEQAGLVTGEMVGPEALEALGRIDLAHVRAYTRKARSLTLGACEVCGLDETAVYGGGLYL